MKRISLAALLLAAVVLPTHAADFGVDRDALLASRSVELFGLEGPLAEGAKASPEEGYRTSTQAATDQVAVAPGLTAEYLTRGVADSLDMMAFWPAENPTHIIGCIESDREEIEPGKWNPSVQSISPQEIRCVWLMPLISTTGSCSRTRPESW